MLLLLLLLMRWGGSEKNRWFKLLTVRSVCSDRLLEKAGVETNNSLQNHPNSLEIVITWCYRKPFRIVFPPCKVSNPTHLNWQTHLYGTILTQFSPYFDTPVGDSVLDTPQHIHYDKDLDTDPESCPDHNEYPGHEASENTFNRHPYPRHPEAGDHVDGMSPDFVDGTLSRLFHPSVPPGSTDQEGRCTADKFNRSTSLGRHSQGCVHCPKGKFLLYSSLMVCIIFSSNVKIGFIDISVCVYNSFIFICMLIGFLVYIFNL